MRIPEKDDGGKSNSFHNESQTPRFSGSLRLTALGCTLTPQCSGLLQVVILLFREFHFWLGLESWDFLVFLSGLHEI